MSVTDADCNTRNQDESGNRERLAEAEAKMEALAAAVGVDMSDEAKARRRRDAEAVRTAEMCGACGGALGPDAAVYRLRFVKWAGFGFGYRTRVLCESCASRPPRPESMRFWLKVSKLRESGMSIEDAYRQSISRNLLYHYCDTCGRKVVWEVNRRDQRDDRKHVFCSERCARDSYRRIRNERNAKAREKVCEVCGEEFTATRRDARTCSPACKQKAYRQRQKQGAA